MGIGKNFFVAVHQDKANAYIQALSRYGWKATRRLIGVRFLLMDADVGAYAKRIDKVWERSRTPTFVYPHAGPPSLLGDFPGHEASTRTRARFVPAAGHKEIMRLYGHKGAIEVTGWAWSKVRPFRPRRSLRRILFMPIHPNANGFLSQRDKDLNQAACCRLVKLRDRSEATLTVRHIGSLENNGLEPMPGVIYIQGQPVLSETMEAIRNADLVVAHHTPAYMAVAMGIPTIMIGEQERPLIGGSEDKVVYVKSFGLYRDKLAYPLDIMYAEDLEGMVQRTIKSDAAIIDWRERMIGKQFDPLRFVASLESYL